MQPASGKMINFKNVLFNPEKVVLHISIDKQCNDLNVCEFTYVRNSKEYKVLWDKETMRLAVTNYLFFLIILFRLISRIC